MVLLVVSSGLGDDMICLILQYQNGKYRKEKFGTPIELTQRLIDLGFIKETKDQPAQNNLFSQEEVVQEVSDLLLEGLMCLADNFFEGELHFAYGEELSKYKHLDDSHPHKAMLVIW